MKELYKYRKIAKEKHFDFFATNTSCIKVKKILNEKLNIQKQQIKKDIQCQNQPIIKQTISKNKKLIIMQQLNTNKLINLYKHQESYDLAIKIAKLYYGQKDYNNSLLWAKKANKLDKTDEESWIIYAKSLYARGDKTQARQLLNIYLKFKPSQKAQKLLNQWK
jgi:tetratricopeptide (TPR) repeat protein